MIHESKTRVPMMRNNIATIFIETFQKYFFGILQKPSLKLLYKDYARTYKGFCNISCNIVDNLLFYGQTTFRKTFREQFQQYYGKL